MRQAIKLWIALSLLALGHGCARFTPIQQADNQPESLIIAENGAPLMSIVISASAPEPTRHAASEMQFFLKEITGAQVPIVTDESPATPSEIWLGNSKRISAENILVDYKALGPEGYIIRTRGKNLLITGGEPRGVLYGVYGFLEDHLGCRWFTPSISTIPKAAVLAILPIDEVRVPVLEYREPFVEECFDGDWAARNRMNSQTARLETRHGGKVVYHGFVHTFEGLVPPDQYFDQHPEYFSLVKGERLKVRSQLCCTNEELIDVVVNEVRKRMREHPEATVFSVSQNDWYNYCECPSCTALAEAEGSQMAPVLHLVNRVARAVKDEFPDKLVDTLAYQYTRKPPATIRPEPNVIIRLCSIECDFSHPFQERTTPENTAFCADLESWAKIANRLWVWNYNTSFSNYLVPFPNLYVRGPNIRYLIANNVRGIFEQDVYNTPHGEFSTLSGYLGAKLLWNPNYDTDLAINEFLSAVYGKAATPIRLYLDLIHEAVKSPDTNMGIWIGPDVAFITDDLLKRADELFDIAENAVANDPTSLEQVRIARLSVDFTIIERIRNMPGDAFSYDHDKFTVNPSNTFRKRVERFFEVAERNGLKTIRENGGELAQYKQEVFSLLRDESLTPLSSVIPANELRPGVLYKYYELQLDKLPDFANLSPVDEGIEQVISLAPATRRQPSACALLFNGYVHAPRDGIYTFSSRSNDGSRMSVGDVRVVESDGLHKECTVTGFLALKKGYHPFELAYFDAGGKAVLEAYYAGPGIPYQAIPASTLWH